MHDSHGEQRLMKTIKSRTVIFFKGEMTALIGLSTSPELNFIRRCDPRSQPDRAVADASTYDSTALAETAFAHSLRLTLERGWQIGYYGPPLRG